MTILFFPDICLPRDPAGFGLWRSGHALEHTQMADILRGATPSVMAPAYNILDWRDEREFVQQWLVTHEQIHEVLRSVCNVTGTDLSLVDFSQDDQFTEWLDDHAAEHQQFRAVLGIT
jgi:hypothetical protein